MNLNKLKNFFSIFLILFIFSPFAYAYVSITQTEKRTDYPGRDVALKIQMQWDKAFPDKKILNVHGNEWLAGNLSYHLKTRPKWYYHDFKKINPRVKISEDYDTYMILGINDLK